MKKLTLRILPSLSLAILLAACGGNDYSRKSDIEKGRQASSGGIYKIGTPYQIEGQWYYPEENVNYVNTGIASWYGEKFHMKRTANGEIFDMNLLTAAHPTLPMPIRARVTNLENGRSLIVRINDRGPFARGREIDLSKRAAEVLGFLEQGTTHVRVEYLSRAPLYDTRGQRIYGAEEEVFIAKKPTTPIGQKQIGAAPVSKVFTQTLDGQAVNSDETELAKTAYTIQVGYFQDSGNAERIRDAVSSYGNADIETVIENGQNFYRVIVGGSNIRDMSLETLQALNEAGFKDAHIIERK